MTDNGSEPTPPPAVTAVEIVSGLGEGARPYVGLSWGIPVAWLRHELQRYGPSLDALPDELVIELHHELESPGRQAVTLMRRYQHTQTLSAMVAWMTSPHPYGLALNMAETQRAVQAVDEQMHKAEQATTAAVGRVQVTPEQLGDLAAFLQTMQQEETTDDTKQEQQGDAGVEPAGVEPEPAPDAGT